jgi:hypothetical protein
MISQNQLREYIIKPALSLVNLYSTDAEELLVFTCATESIGGFYLHQVKGPALGIYQMEPNTYTDIWQNYIVNNPKLLQMIALNFDAPKIPMPDRMIYDLRFATLMSRLHYRRVKEPLPSAEDVDAMWAYYKKYYNTELGAAKKASSIKNYQNFLENKG